MIMAQDGKNKDKTIYQKALTLAKTIKFSNTPQIQSTLNTSLFSTKSPPKNTYVEQSVGPNGLEISLLAK
jgi:hypothetical protein